MKYCIVILLIVMFFCGMSQNNLKDNKIYMIKYNLISKDSLVANKTNDSLNFKIPTYKQGFFCDFEDNIQKKKVPLNFQLGNQKY